MSGPTTIGAPATLSPSGPHLPGKVQTEPEAMADAEAEAEFTLRAGDPGLMPRLELMGLQRPEELLEGLHGAGGASVPPPKIDAPPPRIKPPQWLAPSPPPPPREDFTPRSSEADSNPDAVEADEEEKEIRWSKLKEFLALERSKQQNCRTLPITLALWITFLVLIFHHGQAKSSFETALFIEDRVRSLRTPSPIKSRSGTVRQLHVENIHYLEDILPWTENALVPMLVGENPDFKGLIAQGSQAVINFVRLRQVRGVAVTECPRLTPNLQLVHSAVTKEGDCHPAGGELKAYGVNVTSKDDAWRPEFGGGDNQLVAWIEIPRFNDTIAQRFRILRDGGWLDKNTQEVHIDALMLAPQDYVWSLLTISFKLHREGLMERTVKVRPVQGDIYSNWLNALFDLVWVTCLVILFLSIAFQAAEANLSGQLSRYAFDIYVWMDWMTLIAGVLLGVFYWVLVWEIDKLADDVMYTQSAMPLYAVAESPQNREIEMVIKNRAYAERLTEQLDNFLFLGTNVENHRLISFWYSIALSGRFFRGFLGQPRVALLIQVLSSSFSFLYHYLVVCVLVFGSFTVGGYILFGEQLEQWSSLGSSVASLMGVLFGVFDYEELHNVAPWTAAAWYWALYVIVSLLMMNILTAAIIHRYVDVGRRLGEPGMSILSQIKEGVKVYRFKRTYEGIQKTIPYDELLRTLSKAHEEHLLQAAGRLKQDRRLRTRADLAKESVDPKVDLNFLVSRGCDASTAEHLLERCARWQDCISMTNNPEHRLVVELAQHMNTCKKMAEGVREKMLGRVNFAAAAIDRIDLKHAKGCALARRVKKAQDLPRGWTICEDTNQTRYLLHNETGLTSWRLPKTVIG
eukprot:TRINITY_DN5481_c0_g1_i1.p1 TRINITY_DN5481_c0_g1~~TRINITY_DN5481_c0_g1_i1.p1  ORF type:complete len:856 (-),score=207.45 TRINITY_DN5481_c0_g1_i1:66-2633(-)